MSGKQVTPWKFDGCSNVMACAQQVVLQRTCTLASYLYYGRLMAGVNRLFRRSGQGVKQSFATTGVGAGLAPGLGQPSSGEPAFFWRWRKSGDSSSPASAACRILKGSSCVIPVEPASESIRLLWLLQAPSAEAQSCSRTHAVLLSDTILSKKVWQKGWLADFKTGPWIKLGLKYHRSDFLSYLLRSDWIYFPPPQM